MSIRVSAPMSSTRCAPFETPQVARVHQALDTALLIRQHAAIVDCMLEMGSNSQEEIELIAPLLRLARGRRGVFLEIGASDGVDGSHSLLLEKCFGWNGILVEAQPQSFQHLMQAPRNVVRVHAAACESGRNISMSHVANGIGVAMELATDAYLKRWDKYLRSNLTYQVPCKPLGDIVRDAGFSRIDFLSLDVQGAEELTLKTVDPCIFSMIMAEAEETSGVKNNNVRRMLTKLGFVRRPFPFRGAPTHNRRIAESDLFFHPSVLDDLRPGFENVSASHHTAISDRQVQERQLADALSAIGSWPTSNFSRQAYRQYGQHDVQALRIKFLNQISRNDATDLASFQPLTRADVEAVERRRAAWAKHTSSRPWKQLETPASHPSA